jgi:hypothetical protein
MLAQAPLFAQILDRCFNSVFGQHRAMYLYWRQRQFFGDLGVADLFRFVETLALDPFGQERTRSNCRATAVRFELGILDDAIAVFLQLELVGSPFNAIQVYPILIHIPQRG